MKAITKHIFLNTKQVIGFLVGQTDCGLSSHLRPLLGKAMLAYKNENAHGPVLNLHMVPTAVDLFIL